RVRPRLLPTVGPLRAVTVPPLPRLTPRHPSVSAPLPNRSVPRAPLPVTTTLALPLPFTTPAPSVPPTVPLSVSACPFRSSTSLVPLSSNPPTPTPLPSCTAPPLFTSRSTSRLSPPTRDSVCVPLPSSTSARPLVTSCPLPALTFPPTCRSPPPLLSFSVPFPSASSPGTVRSLLGRLTVPAPACTVTFRRTPTPPALPPTPPSPTLS